MEYLNNYWLIEKRRSRDQNHEYKCQLQPCLKNKTDLPNFSTRTIFLADKNVQKNLIASMNENTGWGGDIEGQIENVSNGLGPGGNGDSVLVKSWLQQWS